jgi:hypothetical protein
VRRLAINALEFLKPDVGVKLFITLLKGDSISTFAGTHVEMARG